MQTFSCGDPTGTRTRVTAVKGQCLNRLTIGPLCSEAFAPQLAPARRYALRGGSAPFRRTAPDAFSISSVLNSPEEEIRRRLRYRFALPGCLSQVVFMMIHDATGFLTYYALWTFRVRRAIGAGDVLLFRAVAHQVSSAQESLTTVFEMGTGVASPLLPPAWMKVLIYPQN